MARRLSRLSIPYKMLADRMTVGGLVAVSVALLVVGKADLKLIDMAATGAGDLAAPALRLVAAPVEAARGAARSIGEALALAEENARLQGQVDRLLAWQAEATWLQIENQALRTAAAMPPIERAIPVTTAAVVGDTGGSFVQTRLIDAGSSRGVAVGQAVIDEVGLVGRIVAVGRSSARVLLITDLNAKIPVRVEATGDRALMEGDNGKRLRLRFLPRDPRFDVGDRVITSGDGGLIPAGIAVGVISRADPVRVEVTPFVDWARLDYVHVVRALPVQPPEEDDANGVGAASATLAADGGTFP
jgi:rod shape-determining protein MreC